MPLQLKAELDGIFQEDKDLNHDRLHALDEIKGSLSRCNSELQMLTHRYLGRGYGRADVEQVLILFSEKTLPKLLRDFKPTEGRFGCFFETRLKWCCLDYKKIKRNQPAQDLASVPSKALVTNGDNPEMTLLRKELREIVDEAMHGLKNEDRQILVWRYFDDLSIQEIARLLSKDPKQTIEEGAVKTRLHRARARLGTILRTRGLIHTPIGGAL